MTHRIARALLSAATALVCATVAAAQTAAPTTESTATPAASVPVPAAPVIALPTPAATSTPTPEPTASFTFRPNPRATATPQPRASATARPAPTPTPVATPGAVPSPVPVPTETPTPVATATATPTPAASPAANTEQGGIDWPIWLAGAMGLALLALLWVRYQRDAPEVLAAAAEEETVADPQPAPPSAPPPSRTAVPGPWLTIALRPIRAGLNLVTAIADCEVNVTNSGDAPADAVRTGISLIAAHNGQAEEIDVVNAGSITRPIVPAFVLAPGESRTFRAIAAAPIETLQTIRVGEGGGGREMLVPLVVLVLQHRDPRGLEHRTSQTFVLGVERVDSPKLAPFWLDSLRMIDQVAARASGATLRRRWPDAAGNDRIA